MTTHNDTYFAWGVVPKHIRDISRAKVLVYDTRVDTRVVYAMDLLWILPKLERAVGPVCPN